MHKTRRTLLAGLGLAAWLAPSSSSADMTGSWRRQIAPHAARWAVSRTESGTLRFEVRDGDCSNDRRTPECVTGRERAELVDDLESRPDTDLWYGYSLLIPIDTPTLQVHVTIGQWWSPDLVLAIRETAGRLGFAIYGSGEARFRLFPIDSALAPRGQWNRIIVHAIYETNGRQLIEAYVNGVSICSWRGAVLERPYRRLPVWKLGLYRPSMRNIPRPHPTQIIFVRDPRRGATRAAVE
jgi:hypothetical protein